jgi:hypothetical protein
MRKNTNINADINNTIFVVANRDGRRFLNRPVYTGRATDMWSSLGEAHVFRTRREAYNCAYDVNRRSDAIEPFAFVVEANPPPARRR